MGDSETNANYSGSRILFFSRFGTWVNFFQLRRKKYSFKVIAVQMEYGQTNTYLTYSLHIFASNYISFTLLFKIFYMPL